MILLCLFWQKNERWSHLNEPFDRKDGDDHGQACGIGVQQTEPLDCMNIYNIKAFTELCHSSEWSCFHFRSIWSHK